MRARLISPTNTPSLSSLSVALEIGEFPRRKETRDYRSTAGKREERSGTIKTGRGGETDLTVSLKDCDSTCDSTGKSILLAAARRELCNRQIRPRSAPSRIVQKRGNGRGTRESSALRMRSRQSRRIVPDNADRTCALPAFPFLNGTLPAGSERPKSARAPLASLLFRHLVRARYRVILGTPECDLADLRYYVPR